MHVPLPIDFPSRDMVCLPLSPQPLQLPQHNHVRIQEPVHTLPHTWLLVFIQFAVLNGPRGDALAETCVGQGVYGRLNPSLLSLVHGELLEFLLVAIGQLAQVRIGDAAA